MAQMKGRLILNKCYKNTFVKNEYITLFWVPKEKKTEDDTLCKKFKVPEVSVLLSVTL